MTIHSTIKKTACISFVFLLWIVAGMGFSGCQKNQDQKTDNAVDTQKNVQATTTTNNYITEYPVYKTNSEKIIAANRDTMIAFKTRLRNVNAKIRMSLDSAEQALERANADLEARIEAFKADGQDAWMQFKAQFDHSMDSVRSSLQDLNNRVSRIKVED